MLFWFEVRIGSSPFKYFRFHPLNYILWIAGRGIVQSGPGVPQEFTEGVVIVDADPLAGFADGSERDSSDVSHV